MPYKAEQRGEDWVVINTDTEEVKATHEPPDAQDKAERQVKLLHAVENDPNWNPEGKD
jgi:hypothetical protein